MILKISIRKILAALIGGILGAVGGNIVYGLLINQVWKPLVVALFFLILSGTIFLSIWLFSKLLGDFDYFMKNPINNKTFKRWVPIMFAAIFLVSMLLEFIYEIGGDFIASQPTSYIFALDISGSMTITDPNNQEAEAVSKIVSQMDDKFPFAVYTFSDGVKCVEKMHKKTDKDNDKKWDFEYYGMTSMYGVIDEILNDYEKAQNDNSWVGGNSPRIILVSDGSPTDGDLFGRSSFNAAETCRKKGVSICGISVVGADQELMSKLSENTGGKSFSIYDIDSLYDSLNSALTAKSEGDRTLISYRGFVANDALFCVLRILFLFVIALAFCGIIYLSNAIYKDWKLIFITKIITAIIASCMVEFSIQSYLGNEIISRTALCMLIAFSILHTIVSTGSDSSDTTKTIDLHSTGTLEGRKKLDINEI